MGVIVAGVMSGTSADGINVALVRLDAGPGVRRRSGRVARSHTGFELVGHAEYSYPSKVRAAVLTAMNAQRASVADLARLNFLLGELYADAVQTTERRFKRKADLVGCHGQTDPIEGWGVFTADRRTLWGHEIKAELRKLPCQVLIIVETTR